jgi:hypothetical protein
MMNNFYVENFLIWNYFNILSRMFSNEVSKKIQKKNEEWLNRNIFLKNSTLWPRKKIICRFYVLIQHCSCWDFIKSTAFAVKFLFLSPLLFAMRLFIILTLYTARVKGFIYLFWPSTRLVSKGVFLKTCIVRTSPLSILTTRFI